MVILRVNIAIEGLYNKPLLYKDYPANLMALTIGPHDEDAFFQDLTPAFTRFPRPTCHRLHWCLDVIFREDAAKLRKDHGPRNVALIRKIILNMLRHDNRWPKVSMRGRRKMAGWDDDERMRVLGIEPL